MANLEVNLGRLRLKNPVMAASGTFACGEEASAFFDINKLGAIVTKTITLKPREGNPPPRIVETPSGMLNSIGLENKGLKGFLMDKIPYLEKLKAPVIASIAGETKSEFRRLAEGLSPLACVKALEINLSCPNIVHKGTRFKLIGQDEKAVFGIISEIRRVTKKTLIAKLSPNVTDIAVIARAAEEAGADSISLVNTFFGMAVEVDSKTPKLGNVFGGLSGPGIKPMAIKCVWDVYNAVKVPIIGIGGIMNSNDAVEFIICGASAIQIGTANFVDPEAPLGIIKGIKAYLKKRKIKSLKNLVGSLDINHAGNRVGNRVGNRRGWRG